MGLTIAILSYTLYVTPPDGNAYRWRGPFADIHSCSGALAKELNAQDHVLKKHKGRWSPNLTFHCLPTE